MDDRMEGFNPLEKPIDQSLCDLIELEIEFEPFNETNNELPNVEQEFVELLGEVETLEIISLDEIGSLEPIHETDIDYDMVFDGLDYYDFDGKDFNQNSEQLYNILDGFQADNWENMALSEQKEQINGLFDYVNDVLRLENPPIIEYYNDAEQGNYGGYNPETNTLSINEYMLYEADEAADTVAHELWHAYQHERASNPQSTKDFQYQFGFDNYIRPGDDFDGYRSQLVEAEARAFADQFKGRIRI